ncbi:MAG: hypothetical protein WEK74_09690, partial [Hydrogenophaga sp.]
ISLTGFLGSESAQLGDLFTGPAGIWSFAAALAQPIYGGGRLEAQRDAAAARERVALAQYQGANLVFAARGVNVQQTAKEADLGVMWSGGGNTALAFLLAGKPVVVLPNQLEPFMQGLRVQEMGAGLVADLDSAEADLPGLLLRALGDPSLRSRAAAFAAKYQGASGNQRLIDMALRLESLAAR